MPIRLRWPLAALLALLLVACGGSSNASAPTATPTVATVPTVTATPRAPTVTPTPALTATPVIVREDIQATHLTIASVGIDADVQEAPTVPYVYVPDPGCPAGPEGSDTVTVPESGIATPQDDIEGLENKAWIFGHSRWTGVPGVFYSLQDISLGDELVIDGVDRQSGETITGKRFVVEGIYLSDVDSGDAFLSNPDGQIPPKPEVVLQTSVRERGANRAWILDRDKLMSKADNVVQGSLDDPCKYLLLFITATPAP